MKSEPIQIQIESNGESANVTLRAFDLPVDTGTTVPHFEVNELNKSLLAYEDQGSAFLKKTDNALAGVLRVGLAYFEGLQNYYTQEHGVPKETFVEALAVVRSGKVLGSRDVRVMRTAYDTTSQKTPEPTKESAELDATVASEIKAFTEKVELWRRACPKWSLDELVPAALEHEIRGLIREVGCENLPNNYYGVQSFIFDAICKAQGERGLQKLKLQINRLRKSRKHRPLAIVARFMKMEQRDLALYRAYFHGMDLVRGELINKDHLRRDGNGAQCLYKFFHSPHEYLDGVVPAAHPIYCLFVQSKQFRERLLAFCRAEEKHLSVVCGLYGAIVAVATKYREIVFKHRAAQKDQLPEADRRRQEQGRQEQRRREKVSKRASRGPEERDVASVPVDNTEAIDNVLSREEVEVLRKHLDPENLNQRFPDPKDRRNIEILLRKLGGFRRSKSSVSDLAKEFKVSRQTIYTWCEDALELLKPVLEEEG